MNERQKRAYLKEKYSYKVGCQDDLEKIIDLDDEIMALDLELKNIDRIEHELVKSGKMSMKQIREMQEVAWKKKIANVR